MQCGYLETSGNYTFRRDSALAGSQRDSHISHFLAIQQEEVIDLARYSPGKQKPTLLYDSEYNCRRYHSFIR